MARLAQLVVDSREPSSLARFWAATLDDFEIRAYDDDEIARLASIGRTPETDPCVILDGPMLEICFQEVEVPAMRNGRCTLTSRRRTESRNKVALSRSEHQSSKTSKDTPGCVTPRATTSASPHPAGVW